MNTFSLKKPLSKPEYVEYRSADYDFPPTALGQTPEIAKALRKLNRIRLIRFLQRVDAFTGYYPPSMLVGKRKVPQPPKLGKKFLARMIATSPALFALLREYHRHHKKISTKPDESDAQHADSVGRASTSDHGSR